MEIKSWKRQFEPHILLRGQDYYESELVDLKRMTEHSIEAFVEGTDVYSVEIALRDGQVLQMSCDCPYAEDGNNCKHMAAVLFAAEEPEVHAHALVECIEERGREERESLETALKQAISSLSEEQLHALLLDAAKKHSDVRDRITLIGKSAVDPSIRERWRADLYEITRRASDRHGFINYAHASDYTLELCRYMDDAILPLLENRLVMDAFDLVGIVFTGAMEQEIDDSGGELGFVASCCQEYWAELIPAPEADQEKMLAWFQAQIRRFSGSYAEDFLWTPVFEHFTDAALLPRILAILDREIQSAEPYALQWLVEQRVALMARMGVSAGEIEAYRMQFWAQPFIRRQRLDQLEASKSWAEALSLLDECERLDAKDRFLLAQYSARRIQILKQSGQAQAWLEEMKRYIFSFPQRDLSYITELKNAVPADQWPPLLEKLFQHENTRGLRRELQLNEGLLEQMMAEMEASSYAYELTNYEKALRQAYPERVRDLLLKQLDQQMRQASTRSAYARVAQSMKRLYGYPEGRQKAAELAGAWRRDYPRRPAMLDELKKVKL